MKGFKYFQVAAIFIVGAFSLQGDDKRVQPPPPPARPAPAAPAAQAPRPQPNAQRQVQTPQAPPSYRGNPQQNTSPYSRPPQTNTPANNPYGRPQTNTPANNPYSRPQMPPIRQQPPYRPQTPQGPRTPGYPQSGYRPHVEERPIRTPGGGVANLRPDGSIHTLSSRGMLITRGPGGIHNITAERYDRSRVYVDRAGYGYVQRPFAYRGMQFASRTYYVNHVSYTNYYRSYPFHGVALEIYTPRAYYAPAFYGWAYRPWRTPVTFAWGWGGSPWYGYYGGAFRPYQQYAGAGPWLTDYLISNSLAGAYQQQVDAAQLNGGQFNPNYPPPVTPMSPQVKDYIDREVQLQLQQAMQNQGGNPVNPGPDNGGIAQSVNDGQPHVFVAGADLDVSDSTGTECAITEGDTVQFNPPPPTANAVNVDVQVLWSKGQDCRTGSTVTIALNQLQEMQNHMRVTVDRGLAELRAQQGTNGIPNAPATPDPAPAPFTQAAPPPDPNVPATLQSQLGTSGQAERDAANSASGQGGVAP